MHIGKGRDRINKRHMEDCKARVKIENSRGQRWVAVTVTVREENYGWEKVEEKFL